MGTSRMRKKLLVGRIQDSSTESRRKMWRGEMSKEKREQRGNRWSADKPFH